jgi:hypothetical protein
MSDPDGRQRSDSEIAQRYVSSRASPDGSTLTGIKWIL